MFTYVIMHYVFFFWIFCGRIYTENLCKSKWQTRAKRVHYTTTLHMFSYVVVDVGVVIATAAILLNCAWSKSLKYFVSGSKYVSLLLCMKYGDVPGVTLYELCANTQAVKQASQPVCQVVVHFTFFVLFHIHRSSLFRACRGHNHKRLDFFVLHMQGENFVFSFVRWFFCLPFYT